MSITQHFNTNWKFSKQDIGRTLSDMESIDILWQSVDIPHDWLIYQSDLYETSEGWYQKIYTYIPQQDTILSLCFDGVYMNSTLYINGKEVGTWQYGYTSFEYEITKYLIPGENKILLKVKHENPNSRWYSGAGIYRNVWLKHYPLNHFLSNGIYISTRKTKDGFQFIVTHELSDPTSGNVFHTLIDQSGTVLMTHLVSGQWIDMPSPILWTLENPYLYTLQSELICEDYIVDTTKNRFGIRTLLFDCKKGFFLNGKHMKLNGVCQHHDLGALGSAFNLSASKRQLSILKEMGVNAIRFSHNMPAQELLDLTDEMGILVINEAFDMWERSKTAYDYARFFKSESAKDVKSWIRRDRNHPSVIMWSIGNEIYDTHVDLHGVELTRYLMEETLKHDPRKNAHITLGSNYMPWENARKCADIIKLIGYNYAEKLYHNDHDEHPDWMIYGSETSSLVQSRGVYHFPLKESILSDDDRQCSALGNSATSWGTKSMEACIIAERDTPFSMGQFIWTGFDYIGEPTPYHTRNSYFGQIDTAGFPKDSFYFYQSSWTHYKENPMIHIAPYWDFNENQLIDVRVMSNAPKVELFLNGTSKGVQSLEHQTGTKLIADYQIPYQKGHLYAIAYDETNEMIARDDKYSFQDAASLLLTPDKIETTANGEDLIFITIQTKDLDGRFVENANNRVFVKVEGEGRLVGLDNGDSTDTDSYKGTSRRLFNGKLLAIVAPTLTAGNIMVNVTSPYLTTAHIELTSIDSPSPPVVSSFLSCNESAIISEIPVRKIEILAMQGQQFTKTQTTLRVEAKLYPNDATYQDITWQITNDAGVPVKLASFEKLNDLGTQLLLTAHGDGDFRLRASCKNKKIHADIISALEFHIDGIGSLTQNPYEFISGSLFDSFEGEVSNGNERGVATARDQKTILTYENLDFGDYGSDCLTIPIFELESASTIINFYEGHTLKQNGTFLGSFCYHKQSIWNVYQEETFLLNKRLTGVTSLSIEVEHKIHIKGFSFTKIEKAFEKLYATEANHIYGDTYTQKDTCVEGIGNNVSFEFQNMDFGERGVQALTICGHSPIDKNTIHIRFQGKDGDAYDIAEFAYTKDYEEQNFSLSPIYGAQTVTFVFLPGSNFDFKWFQFH